jgi:HTH-type transcriptional regulator, sugar sensing transcriptional regulator
MDNRAILMEFGFSKYETDCYMALLAHHPSNGSQLSKHSGVARSRIYDVLRNLAVKGMVFEAMPGQYVPLPPEELKKRLISHFQTNLSILEEQLNDAALEGDRSYILTLKGYRQALDKAVEIIQAARKELYVRLFPHTGDRLEKVLQQAAARGVGVRYIGMGKMRKTFAAQIIHPHWETLYERIGGESIDIVADREEALVGMFAKGREEQSSVIWSRNHWFVVGNRDSLQHDFYHYFLDKVYDRGQPLTTEEKKIYDLIKSDV